MIEIHLLEQLAAFADYGTLSEAAERLHTSQPARQLRKDELITDKPLKGYTEDSTHLSIICSVSSFLVTKNLKQEYIDKFCKPCFMGFLRSGVITPRGCRNPFLCLRELIEALGF